VGTICAVKKATAALFASYPRSRYETIMLRRLYDWTLNLAQHRHAMWALAAVAFIESSIFPIPPDILIIAMVLAAREKAWKIAVVATVASVLGGVFGYAIGALLFQEIGRPIIEFYGYGARYQDFSVLFNEWGWWIVVFAGVTPFPYKVITIASGVADLNLVVFMMASILSRGFRFFVVAALLWKFGPPIRDFIEARLGILFTIFMVGLIGGFVAVKYLI